MGLSTDRTSATSAKLAHSFIHSFPYTAHGYCVQLCVRHRALGWTQRSGISPAPRSSVPQEGDTHQKARMTGNEDFQVEIGEQRREPGLGPSSQGELLRECGMGG